ncbi:MAG: helix-turn-helix domain-containing protein [Dyadobacter fermentans]
MSIVSNNIKYLRRLNGLTQEQFARKIAIKRSLLGAYEEARANPNLTNLKNMAAAFGVSVDNLLKNDLRKLRETPEMSLPLTTSRQMTVSHSGLPQSTPTRTPGYMEPQPLSKIIETYQQPEQPLRQVSRQINLKPVGGEMQQPVQHFNAASPQALPFNQPGAAQPVAAQPGTAQPNAAQLNAAQPAAAQQEVFQQPNFQQPAPSRTAATYQQPAAAQPAGFPTFNNQYQSPQFNAAVEQPAQHFPTIQWVARNQQADYIANFQNPHYLNALPLFQLPNLPTGYYRAFESGEDFTYPGSILVGTFIRNWYDIKDGMQYIFLLRSHGLIYRNVFNQVKTAGTLLLTSDNASIADLEIPLQDVLEVWEVKAFVSVQMPVPQPSLERVTQLVDELQMELSQYRQ